MPRRVRLTTTAEVAGADGTVTTIEVPRQDVWALGIPYGYVFNRRGIATARYCDRYKSTGLLFVPRNRRAAVARAEQWIVGLLEPPDATITPDAPTFVSAFDLYSAAKLTGESTRAARRRWWSEMVFRKFIAADTVLTDAAARQVTREGVARLTANLAPASVHLQVVYWRMFMTWCRANGWIACDPVALVALPEVARKKSIDYSDEELARIDRWAAANQRRVFRLLWKFLALTGARIHEALALQPSNILLAAPVPHIHFTTTKGNRPRVFPLAVMPQLPELVAEILALELTPLFGSLSDETTLKELRRVLTAEKISGGPRPQHKFRDTAQRRMRELGIPAEVRARLLGHSVHIMLEHYDPTSSAAELLQLSGRT